MQTIILIGYFLPIVSAVVTIYLYNKKADELDEAELTIRQLVQDVNRVSKEKADMLRQKMNKHNKMRYQYYTNTKYMPKSPYADDLGYAHFFKPDTFRSFKNIEIKRKVKV